MSTYVKSVFLARIGLATHADPVLKNQIIEVPNQIGERLLTRVAFCEDLGKDVNLWELSTAKAFKEQSGVAEAEPVAPAALVIPDQQLKNTNETNEHENHASDATKPAKAADGNGVSADRAMRLSSEGEESPEAKAVREESEKAAAEAVTAPAKPAAKAPAKAADKPAAKRPAKPAQRPTKPAK